MKKIVSLLLALTLSLSCFLPALADEAVATTATYPTEWDLTEIYATPDDWQADYDKVMELINGYGKFRGTLNNAQSIKDYYEFAYLGELTAMQNRLSTYASLGNNLNPADSTYRVMLSKLSAMSSTESQLSAFAEPEIFALPLEEREAIFADPLLTDYAYFFREYIDPEHEPLSEDAITALAVVSPAMNRANSIYDIMYNVDLPYPTITTPDGIEIVLDDSTYAQIVYGDEYDRDFKSQCNELVLTRNKPFANTFAALLESNAMNAFVSAQLNNYATTRESALASDDVEPEIYDMLIEAAHKGAADYQRYLNTHKRGLGLDVQYPFDTATSVSDYDVPEITYDAAVDQVRTALSILGEDYIAIYDEIVNSNHLDVYPTDTKTGGAYSTSIGDKSLPYMMFNFSGIPSDVSTLAHEMGHSLYSYFSEHNQPTAYNSPTIFTHEVASITNELLYYSYMIEHAQSDDERIFYLEEVLNMFSSAFFTQTLFSEFEDSLYKTIEAGGTLDAETISQNWYDLYQQYRGDSIKAFPDSRYYWVGIPHFYYVYYVYKYATSVSYAAAICSDISSGKEGALESYREFLNLGGSAKPSELLNVAGVNPLDSATYENALSYYSNLVDQYEELVDAKLAAEADVAA